MKKMWDDLTGVFHCLYVLSWILLRTLGKCIVLEFMKVFPNCTCHVLHH